MLKIKLTRLGKKKEPRYRIVVNEARDKRDGQYVALLGTYQPAEQPKILELDTKAYEEWLAKGAQPTETVAWLYEQAKGQGLPEKKKPKLSKKAKARLAAEAEEKAATEAAAKEAAEAEKAAKLAAKAETEVATEEKAAEGEAGEAAVEEKNGEAAEADGATEA